ncbi:MAG: helix-turn-helix transcriptional regulator [Nannocystales bacterium]
MTKQERLDALLSHLRAHDGCTMGTLSAALNVSVRTIRRDVESLRSQGVDLEGARGRGGGVRLARHAALPMVRLSEAEAVALWLSAQVGRRACGLPFTGRSGAAVTKVVASLPEDRRRQLKAFVRRIVVASPATAKVRASVAPISSDLLPVFEGCFSRRLCLCFRYADRRGKTSTRIVEPHGILVQTPVWYVLALDTELAVARMFRMDRITHARRSTLTFVPNAEVIAALIDGVPR